MAISYHVYANDGRGGPIDYSEPIATVPATSASPVGSFSPGPLASPSDNSFAVRAFDDESGVEEANTDARVRVAIDAQGRDVSTRPNPVIGLAVRWSVGEVGLVSWNYTPAGEGGPPAQFEVIASPLAGSGVSSPPMQSVSSAPGLAGHGCRLEGLSTASAWVIQVRAVGATDGVVGPTVSASLAKQSGGLAPVDALVATASA